MESNRVALSLSIVSLVLATAALGMTFTKKSTTYPNYKGLDVEGSVEANSVLAETIVAERIMIRGDGEHYLVYLGPDTESKAGSIRIADAEGREIAGILRSRDSGGGWLHLSGPELGSKVILSVDQNGEGSLWLVAKDPKETIMLSPYFERVRSTESDEPATLPVLPAGIDDPSEE